MLVTLLGAFLRWYRLGDTRILWDHAYPVAQAVRLLQQGVWPTLGQPTSFFLSNPPGQAYISVLPQAIWNSFWLTFWFITALNVLAVPLLYSLTRPYLSEKTALIAAFLYAVNPWVVNYSRTSWSSALLPVGCVLVLGLLLRAVAPRARHRNLTMLAMFTSLALLGQTYFLAMFLVPAQAAAAGLTRLRAIPWRGVLWGMGVFGVGLAFYGAAVASDIQAQLNQANRLNQAAGQQAHLSTQALDFGLSYVTGAGYLEWLPIQVAQPVEWLLELAFILGLGVAAARLVRRRPDGWVGLAVFAWWLAPVLLFSDTNQPLYQWHLRSTMPAGQLLAAIGLGWLVQLWPRTRPAWLAVGAALAVVSFGALRANVLDNAAQPGPGPGASLDQITLNASMEMGGLLNHLLTTYKTDEVYSSLPDVVPTAWTGRPVENVGWSIDGRLLILPDDRPALYMRTTWGMPPAPLLGNLPNAQRVAQMKWPGSVFTAVDLLPALDRQAEAQLPKVRLDWPSDTGLTLLGYTLEQPLHAGQTSTVMSYWRIDTLEETRGQYIFGPYLHLVNPNGSLAVNASAPGLPGYYYRQGDLYLEPIRVAVPVNLSAGLYNLDMGLYDGLHSAGTTFHPQGQPDQSFYRTQTEVQ